MRRAFAALTALSLAACAAPSAIAPSPTPSVPLPAPAPGRLELTDLPGWAGDDHLAAFEAYRRACEAAADPAYRLPCGRAKTYAPGSAAQAEAFLVEHFQAEPMGAPGVLTGYFAPVYPARRAPDGAFTAAVRPRPADLAAGQPYAERAQIEAQPAEGALAWMRPEDLFFLQTQGSGVLVFEDGRRMKALFAAHNSRPFTGIAAPMRERGLLPADGTSAQAIRAWLAAHRGPEADAIMRLNPRYAFFTLAPDDGRPPPGAAGVPLPAGRAAAVDPAHHAFGEPLWIDADQPRLAGAPPRFRGLVTALDTGGAIRGPARADLFVGQGDAAGELAGRINHTLRLYRLVPR